MAAGRGDSLNSKKRGKGKKNERERGYSIRTVENYSGVAQPVCFCRS